MIDDACEAALHTARALVLHDLRVYGLETPQAVSAVEEAVAGRRWWVGQWPEGAAYVAGLVAQDVQEALAEAGPRWPDCPDHAGTDDEHQLYIEPELGEDPQWVCESSARLVAPLGSLPGRSPAENPATPPA